MVRIQDELNREQIVTLISQALHYSIQLHIIEIVALFYHIQFLVEESNGMILLAQRTAYAYAEKVTSHLKYLREIRKVKNWGSSQLVLDFLESSSSSFSPFELLFFKAFSNWGHNDTKTSDKSPIKRG